MSVPEEKLESKKTATSNQNVLCSGCQYCQIAEKTEFQEGSFSFREVCIHLATDLLGA